MTSSINANNIDGAYPVAGQDNDSQGFRDNFTNIKTNFQFAADEITELQNKVILKAPLSGGANLEVVNNMAGSPLIDFQAQDVSYKFLNLGNITGSQAIDYALGVYQQLTTSGSVSLSFTNFPSSGIAGVVTVMIAVTNVAHTVTLPAAVGTGNSLLSAQNIIGLNTGTNVITFDSVGTYVFEFRTNDGGSSIYIQDLVRTSGVTQFSQLNDVDITSPANNDLLIYNSTGNVWVNSPLGNTIALGNLVNVSITNPANNDLLIYNSSNSTWENIADADFVPVTTFAVTVADNGSGSQDVFFLDGTALETNTGNIFGLQFEVENRYRFDLSDASNADAPLRFSTTPDTIVTVGNVAPSTITPYANNVTIVGNAGTSGSYVEILITQDTPTPLYLWGIQQDPGLDTSLIGAALPISVGQINYFFGEDTFAANGNISLQTGTTVITSSSNLVGNLAAGTSGQIKVLAYGNTSAGNTLITVADAAWGGSNIANLSARGSAATFQYVDGKWFCVGNNGVTFS
jgi:hypothetical protein